MMLRPVELDAAADPRPGQADQRRLDDRLVVDEVVAVGLVEDPRGCARRFPAGSAPEEYSFSIQIAFHARSTGFSAMRSVNGRGYTRPLLP
jgi:hypothetical protein